jgi:PAS domain S-box-containing protein
LKCYPVLCVGDEARAVIIAKDVTKQKEAESELLRVYTAVEEAMEAIIITDLEGRAAYVNRAFSDMLGYSREDLKKETIHSIYADNEEKDSLQQQQSEDAKGFWQWKTHLKKTDGTAIPALIRTTPIPDQNDLPVEMLFIITDLTQHEREEKERRQLELQLSQAQKLESIGQLAAGIAHEINTPTQFVGDNTNFLRDSFEGITKALDACSKLLDAGKSGAAPQELFVEASNIFEEEDVDYLKEEIPEAIEQSLGGIKRISDIVLAMKEFSHPKADEKKATDIHKAIENTLTVSRNEWKYVADAKTDFTEDSPIVECYPGELNQVFLNMFVNAAHTIADANKVRNASKGLITIKTERSGGFFKISVSDTGMGIPEDVRPRIFDMFFTTKDVGKGTGQGLSLAYDAIVNKHGGRLSFDTTEEKGTTFHIELPLKDK